MSLVVDGRALREAAAGPLAARISPRFLDEHLFVPLTMDAGVLTVACGHPLTEVTKAELARFYGAPVQEIAVPVDDLRAALLGVTREPIGGLAHDEIDRERDVDGSTTALGVSGAGALSADEAPVVTLVNGLLRDALRTGASDVHVESTAEGLRVRFRLDGVLQDIARPPREYRDAVVSRLKVLAGLDIGERRLPQDGRVRLRLEGRDVDLRVSTLPSLHGESLVLRILDYADGARSLHELGVPTALRPSMDQLLARSSGLTLVTGPTGSGKTTTLYAALTLRNQPGIKVVTVEDPVEYRIPGVVQVPVNRKAGLTFASALRSILRHDPDVIMIGEMRDVETASIALRAALTGHQVLSTLHTTDAASAVVRLIDMGIEPYLVASTLQGILAQRLVRVVCAGCAAPTDAPSDIAPNAVAAGARWRRAVGCEQCVGTGYRGRTGVFELITISDAFRTLIARGASLDALRAAAQQEGVMALRDAGIQLAAAGVTTMDEIHRVFES